MTCIIRTTYISQGILYGFSPTHVCIDEFLEMQNIRITSRHWDHATFLKAVVRKSGSSKIQVL